MLLSLHIPKTAGSTFREILREVYTPDIVLDYSCEWGSREIPPELSGSTRCIHGHFNPEKYAGSFSDAQWITWVREPAERVVSAYYQYQNFGNPENPEVRKYFFDNQVTLEEFIELGIARNVMCKSLFSFPPANFDFIGIVEQFEKSMLRINSLCGTDMTVPGEKLNVHKPAPGQTVKVGLYYKLTPQLRKRIMDLNKEDYDLYYHAFKNLG